MGLLDQVIGQVVGGMLGGGSSGRATPGGFGSGAGGLPGNLGGLLPANVGRYAPLVMALLSLLASRQGSAGSGNVLGDILGRLGGGGLPDTGGQTPAPSQSGGGGSFNDEIGSLLGGGAPSTGSDGGSSGGLGGLLDRLRGAGLGGHADSWIGTGANQAIDPAELDRALGSGTVDTLARQTGTDKGELLRQLSEALPQVIDGLTPGGKPPTSAEEARWL